MSAFIQPSHYSDGTGLSAMSPECPLGQSRPLGHEQSLLKISVEVENNLKKPSRNIVKAGQLLLQAKMLIGHGMFISWLRTNFRMSAKTANRYMSVAQLVERYDLDDEAIEKINALDLRVIYELAAKSTPVAVQQLALADLRNGKIDYKQIQSWIQLAQQESPSPLTLQASVALFKKQFGSFENWLAVNETWLKRFISQLSQEDRQAMQQQAYELREAISRFEKLLV